MFKYSSSDPAGTCKIDTVGRYKDFIKDDDGIEIHIHEFVNKKLTDFVYKPKAAGET